MALGPDKLIAAAVPGLLRDLIAFTAETIPLIDASLDFWNIMTYDLMNRRDTVTKHHTGITLSLAAVDTYLERGVPAVKAHLGFPFYIKWFRTDPKANCSINPLGCPTLLLEDPSTGADLGHAGGFCWVDNVPGEVATSYAKAMENGQYDPDDGGHYYWDPEEKIFWSWETPESIALKFPAIMEKKSLGGVFAWGLGEDSKDWRHVKALTAAYRRYHHLDPGSSGWRKDEL